MTSFFDGGGQDRKLGQGRKHPVWPLGYVNFTKDIFRPITRLNSSKAGFPEGSGNFYSVLPSMTSIVATTILLIFLL